MQYVKVRNLKGDKTPFLVMRQNNIFYWWDTSDKFDLPVAMQANAYDAANIFELVKFEPNNYIPGNYLVHGFDKDHIKCCSERAVSRTEADSKVIQMNANSKVILLVAYNSEIPNNTYSVNSSIKVKKV